MGSRELGDVTAPEEQEQGRHSLIVPLSDDALIEKMENVVLQSDFNQGTVVNGDGRKENCGLECRESLPLRPYAGDCPHYIRTGSCKFGLSCRYNHPIKRTQQFGKGRDSDSENSGTIECKYFSIAGACRYGKSCRYRHLGEESENIPELNFLGLPIRPDQKECLYYIRYGSCGYGSRCVYHHPDPTSMVGKEFPKSLEETFWRQAIPDNYYRDSQHMTGASQPDQASWSLHKFSNNGGSYSENFSSYEPVNPCPQWMNKQSEWNGYQSSSYSHQNRTSANGSESKPDITVQVDEFPERPGQPECSYFMTTGNCKFKLTCRFHHPKNWRPKPEECVLNENGLPLRPGKRICRHYERHGLCKVGRACKFDHPASRGLVSHESAANLDLPVSQATVDGCGGGGWDD